MNYTCLMYSEGGSDKKFLNCLISLKKFKDHTKKWTITTDNASGSSPEVIINQCEKSVSNINYDVVECFIDLDSLKSHHPKVWERKQKELEINHPNIVIIWQKDNAEDEFRRVLGEQVCKCGKYTLNKTAQKSVEKFINSDFWKRILNPIEAKERNLEKEKKKSSISKS